MSGPPICGIVGSEMEGATRQRLRTPIVGIGASAGGLSALRELFHALPPDTGAAFVVVQHLDPARTSSLAELLARETPMPVCPAETGAVIEPDHVYVIPPNRGLTVTGGVLQLRPLAEVRVRRFPIDDFLISLAEHCRERAVAVILSGSGSDGTHGLVAVKHAGGLTIVQEPATATHDGMPRAALATGMVDAALPPTAMPSAIQRFLAHPYARGELTEAEVPALDTVIARIREVTHHDFTEYKKGTLTRRVLRRMSMAGIRDVARYLELLAEEPEEVRRLYADCLIGVTRFFREPEVFAQLEREVLPGLLAEGNPTEPVRAWVPGCATGEEAYSVAMLLLEQVTQGPAAGRDVIVFATDLDERALAVARDGHFSDERMAGVPDARRTRFFKREGDGWRVGRELRESLVFAPQNLMTDPPFSQLDLVSCRNVLIYFEAEAQRRLISVFHFALRRRGVLLLGPAEGLAGRGDLFTAVSERHRIYRKNPNARREALDLPQGLSPRVGPASPVRGRPTTLRELVDRALAEDYGPASVLCDARGDALYFSGPVSAFLAQPTGEPTRSLVELAGPSLRGRLRLALHGASRDDRRVVERVRMSPDGHEVLVGVRPVRSDEETLYLVTFTPVDRPAPPADPADPAEASAIARLERELGDTRDDLQTTIEELESANEELKASNEEIMSMNEELQSTNEELETSKEELQSLNEELNTVNGQLQEKVVELERTMSDLENLLSSSEVSTLFLDRDLAIRRFTPATLQLFRLIESDLGRPIEDIAVRFEQGGDIISGAREALSSLSAVDDEVKLGDDTWFRRRIRPYRTLDDRIDGVVVTFSDVTPQKHAEHAIARARDQLEALVAARTAELRETNERLAEEVVERTAAEQRLRSVLATAADGIVTIDERSVIRSVNAAAERMFGYDGGELVGQPVEILMPSPYRERHTEYIARYHRTGERRVIGIGRQTSGRRKDGTTFAVELAVGEADTAEGRRYTGIIRDISDRKRLEDEIRQAQKMEAVGRLASGVAHDFNNLLMAISGAASMAVGRLEPSHPALTYLREIANAAQNGASISRQLLALARPRDVEPETVDLGALVQRNESLLTRLLGAEVELSFDLPDAPVWVKCDRGQLDQVLLNLVVNSRDAMPEGGRIEVSVFTRELDAAAARTRTLSPGMHVLLSIRDTGVGIEADALPHIFEPFFTTKGEAKGTGLGLSTVYGIVKQSGGHVDVSTERGAGTTFTLYLPLDEAGAPDPEPLPASEPVHAATVLVVEDEPLVRMTVRHYLEAAGYRVIEANDGDEAMQMATGYLGEVSVLLTDVVLPKRRGADIAAAVRERWPDVEVLFMSAHPLDFLLEEKRVPVGAKVLQKPFTEEQLLHAVSGSLGDHPPTLLVVEDDPRSRDALRELFVEGGYRVLAAASKAEALAQVHGLGGVDVLVTDVVLPDLAPGEEHLADVLRREVPVTHVIYLSGSPAPHPELAPLLEDPTAVLFEKPCDLAALEAQVVGWLGAAPR
ncbi:MAG: PAS domain S-box protein [Myxococcales bacterium]|nr:PAS domain S-box protein [Myxococcales bacterium]